MNSKFLVVFTLLAAAFSAVAAEKLPVLKVGSEVYSNVTVTIVTATEVSFTHAGGMAIAKLKNLDPDLQKHFQYDPVQAAEAERKQTEANAQYQTLIARQPTPRPRVEEPAAPPTTAAETTELSWGTDLPAATQQARTENKMVLINFTGSDWCTWCQKFDREALSTAQFAAYARNNLVLVALDFPRQKKQSDALKQANLQHQKNFKVDGFPTFVVLNAAGKEIGRQVGYKEGGPAAFIAELQGFRK